SREECVVERDWSGIVSKNLGWNEIGDTSRFEHRHRAVAQAVERKLAGFARPSPAHAGASTMATRFNKPGFNQDLPELIAQCAGPVTLRRIWKNVRVRVKIARNRSQVVGERLDQWKHDSPPGLFRGEGNLVGFKVDSAPC